MRFYTGVGSRETPELMLLLMELMGELLCTLGYRGRSGAAPGADSAFRRGARKSERYTDVGFEDYLPNSTMFNSEHFGFVKPDSDERIFDARSFDAYERSVELALEARGSWNGLGPGGIQLHSRNPMQVLGGSLKLPSKFCLFYAKPVGRKGMVSGGTNTAVQVCRKFNVPLFNLYDESVQERLIRSLHKHLDSLSPQSQELLLSKFPLENTDHAIQEPAVSPIPEPKADHAGD